MPTGAELERRTVEKQADIELAARAEFELMKIGIEELATASWDTLPSDDAEHSPRTRAYYQDKVQPTVEALWRAGRLEVSPKPPVRGEKWEHMIEAGLKSGMTREASEAHADTWAVRVGPKLSTDEAADEYGSALAKELSRVTPGEEQA